MLKAIVVSCAAFLALATPLLAAENAPQAVQPAPDAQQATQPAPAAAGQEANADVPQSVKDACQADYEKFCSQHQPESAEVRVCMAGAFENLSETCVTAILDSPLAEQAAQQVEAARGDAAEEPPAASSETATLAHVQPRKAVSHARNGHTRRVNAATAQRIVRPKITIRIARVRPAPHDAKPRKGLRYAGYRTNRSRRSVSGYIRRGTGIANYYVAKYTRIGFAKAFR